MIDTIHNYPGIWGAFIAIAVGASLVEILSRRQALAGQIAQVPQLREPWQVWVVLAGAAMLLALASFIISAWLLRHSLIGGGGLDYLEAMLFMGIGACSRFWLKVLAGATTLWYWVLIALGIVFAVAVLFGAATSMLPAGAPSLSINYQSPMVDLLMGWGPLLLLFAALYFGLRGRKRG